MAANNGYLSPFYHSDELIILIQTREKVSQVNLTPKNVKYLE